MTPIERFTAKYIVNDEGCWEWQGTKARGYASFSVGKTKVRGARWSYEHFKGPIPDGEEIDHICHSRSTTCPGGLACRHRRCVNPDHLESVTKTEHGLRTRLKVCEAGLHDLTDPANRYRTSDVRGCYACKKDRMRERYATDPEYRKRVQASASKTAGRARRARR